MKKSVVILIALIYVLSIGIVSFFGLQFKIFDEVISVERIEILNKNLDESSALGKYAVIEPDANGERRYHIEYRVYPDNATESKVEFSYDKKSAPYVSVNENGLVTFSSPGAVKILLIATDGSNIETSITLIAK